MILSSTILLLCLDSCCRRTRVRVSLSPSLSLLSSLSSLSLLSLALSPGDVIGTAAAAAARRRLLVSAVEVAVLPVVLALPNGMLSVKLALLTMAVQSKCADYIPRCGHECGHEGPYCIPRYYIPDVHV